MSEMTKKKDEIKLSDHFTYSRLLKFTLPSMAMMIFTSIYGVVDGIFVSNYVGETPFAALNLIMPYVMIFSAIGTMLGVGGSALVAFTLGTGDKEKANELFSLVIYLLIIIGAVVTVMGMIFAEPAARLLGADDGMLPYCIQYARICYIGSIPLALQYAFQSLFIVAEKPKLGLYVTVAAGITNMFLDWLFVGLMKLGLAGAAYATVIGIVVGGIIPLVYFIFPNTSLLRLGKTRWHGNDLLKVVTNGSSEFLSNISMSVVSMLYNLQLMKYAGQSGVAAYGIIMYTNFIFIGCFFGYAMGVASIIGYNYGAADHEELKNIFRRSMKMIAISSFIMVALSVLLARPLAYIFAGNSETLLRLSIRAIRIYSVCYLFAGINIFGSSFFTALNNGLISALISFMRVLVLQVLFVMTLPILWGLDGIWISIVMAELCSVLITAACLVKNRLRYSYA